MVQARICQGRVEPQDPLPADWEGQYVNLVPLSPDDPHADLERHLSALHSLGPMEYLPGEQEAIENELAALNRLSQTALAQLDQP